MKMTTPARSVVQSGIKVLVYGAAGVGKTFLCSTAPKPLIISAESGLLSIAHRDDIPVIEVKEIKDVYEAYTWVQTNAAKYGIETLCLDSLSEIGERVLAAEKKKSNDPRRAYGALVEEVLALAKAFRDLPHFNVVFTAKEDITTNPVTNATKAAPSMPGQRSGPELPYLFDEVFHMATARDGAGQTYRYLRTSADSTADAKDRSGKLEPIEYPDLSAIFAKIKQPKGA